MHKFSRVFLIFLFLIPIFIFSVDDGIQDLTLGDFARSVDVEKRREPEKSDKLELVNKQRISEAKENYSSEVKKAIILRLVGLCGGVAAFLGVSWYNFWSTPMSIAKNNKKRLDLHENYLHDFSASISEFAEIKRKLKNLWFFGKEPIKEVKEIKELKLKESIEELQVNLLEAKNDSFISRTLTQTVDWSKWVASYSGTVFLSSLVSGLVYNAVLYPFLKFYRTRLPNYGDLDWFIENRTTLLPVMYDLMQDKLNLVEFRRLIQIFVYEIEKIIGYIEYSVENAPDNYETVAKLLAIRGRNLEGLTNDIVYDLNCDKVKDPKEFSNNLKQLMQVIISSKQYSKIIYENSNFLL